MKIFEEWLDEGTSSKQIEVPGWKKSTKAKLIKELTDKKSLYVSTWGPSDKDGEYILDAMKEEFTDSKLKKVFSVLSSTNKWRTVSGASQTKLIFRPEGRVDFNQEGDKWFYEKKFFNGTVFLFYTRTHNKQWDDWSHLFIFYYVPDNIEGEWLEEEQKFSKGQSNEFDYDIMDRLEKSADIKITQRKSDISYHGKDTVYIITLSDKKTKPTVEIKYSYTLHGEEAPFDKQLIRMFSVSSPTLDEDDLEDIYDACKKFIKKWWTNGSSLQGTPHSGTVKGKKYIQVMYNA